jgi:DNA invertase Pin-like site-specific DNA recombinase
VKRKEVVGYARTSLPSENLSNQIDQIRKIAGDSVIIFEDAGVSGSVPPLNRFGFKEMMNHIKTHDVARLYVAEISRIGRTMRETLSTIGMIEEDLGVMVFSISLKESWLNSTDPSVRSLILSIFAWTSEWERNILIERTKAGIERARKEGKHIGRPKEKIDWKKVKKLRAPAEDGRQLSYSAISLLMQVPYSTLIKHKKEHPEVG